MKSLGYIWKVIINIITVIIVLGIFSIASTDFETVVFAVLILIYLSITGFSTIWGLQQMDFGEALQKELDLIKTKLGIILYDDEDYTEEYKKELEKEREEKKNNTMIKFYINAGFQVIIYIISLYYLLTVL